MADAGFHRFADMGQLAEDVDPAMSWHTKPAASAIARNVMNHGPYGYGYGNAEHI